ncbi:MAG: BON domain-containing protein [Alphaproteobacteria bacterium]
MLHSPDPLSHPIRLAALGLAAAMTLAACSPAGRVVGAGATAGVAASEERGLKGAGNDALIRVEINKAWITEDFDTFNRLNLQIYEGRVLISGRVPNQANADRVVELAWRAEDVREVINEIEIAEGGGLNDFANDALINARLDSELLFDSKISSINYSTRSVAGTVYLLGVAQDREELDRVFRVTRSIPNVKRVVSHVILKDDPRRVAAPAEKPTQNNAPAR